MALDELRARHDRREVRMAQLLFAARDLAKYHIALRDVSFGHAEQWRAVCCECDKVMLHDEIRHTDTCRTGRVLHIVDELLAVPDDTRRDAPKAAAEESTFDPKKKEAAPAEETVRPDDGMRPRGLHEGFCLKCGKHDGNWDAELYPEDEFDLRKLKLNQHLEPSTTGKGYLLYTHHCAACPQPSYSAFCPKCGVKNDAWDKRMISNWEAERTVLGINEHAATFLTADDMHVIFTHHCASPKGGAQ
jgi:hypothetical protein